MELIGNNKPIIICAGIKHWYPVGAVRLERSLIFNGWPCAIKIWTDYPEGCPAHEDVPYYFKISAFEWAIKEGYTHILWCDCSLWSVRNPMALFDLINDQGYWFFSSGYNLAQTANDAALEGAGISRDEAESATEWASGCLGFNFFNPDGKRLYTLWKEYMDKGMSRGSRNHDGGSEDPRFLHHRQDQTCLSLAAHKLGLRNKLMLDAVAYKNTNYDPEQILFFIEGVG